ncbi:MAG: hypothetical protein KGQ80_09405, partial [Bacteroidetes bacterium]|nr:hypothetical protein [Bacteroidota bacterium]
MGFLPDLGKKVYLGAVDFRLKTSILRFPIRLPMRKTGLQPHLELVLLELVLLGLVPRELVPRELVPRELVPREPVIV